jgi:hypothetical protein
MVALLTQELLESGFSQHTLRRFPVIHVGNCPSRDSAVSLQCSQVPMTSSRETKSTNYYYYYYGVLL